MLLLFTSINVTFCSLYGIRRVYIDVLEKCAVPLFWTTQVGLCEIISM